MKIKYLYFSIITVFLGLAAQAQTAISDTVYLSELEIVSSRTSSKQPYTVTEVSSKEINDQLGSRDLPNILSVNPSTFSTNQGGGAGDSRLNVRGFNQRNVAIMINGVPVNDMENGWVYWSNWDGVGESVGSIQVQRGMSSINLAVPSIGGTVNIITSPSAQEFGGAYKTEIGSWNFVKNSYSVNTGLINDKWALSGVLTKKTGDGFYNGTWVDAMSYYLGVSYKVSDKTRLEAYALGAPQRHGQNLYRQNIARYSAEYAKSLEGYDPNGIDAFSELGRNYNQNFNKVSASYKGEQFFNMYGVKLGDRFNSDFINERENYFHKPQVNFNVYTDLNDNLKLANIFYYSGGYGGGSGTMGSVKSDASLGFARNWNAEVNENVDKGYSTGILRNSVNIQSQIGGITKLYQQIGENLNITYGLDYRIARVHHFREVRDLLGGSYYLDNSNDFNPDNKALLGDTIGYFNTNDISWLGGYIQMDYQFDRLSTNLIAGFTSASYSYTDHFRMAIDSLGEGSNELGEFVSTNKNLPGFQIKGGWKYKMTDNSDYFVNLGYIKSTPTFDKAINDASGKVYAQSLSENETFQSAEMGINSSSENGKFATQVSGYYTLWLNRTNSRFVQLQDGTEDIVYLTGMNARHMGVEIEASYKPIENLRIDLGASFGDWTLTSDVNAEYTSYADPNTPVTTEVDYYLKGLHVGDAPQNQISGRIQYNIVENTQINLNISRYSKYYADWNVFDRTNPSDRAESWQLPTYTLVDWHVNHTLYSDDLIRVDLFGHVYNLFDAVYVQDATDNSAYNAFGEKSHKADDAEVFLGLPRNYNFGVKVSF